MVIYICSRTWQLNMLNRDMNKIIKTKTKHLEMKIYTVWGKNVLDGIDGRLYMV
jgi:hypothetical protein